MLNLFRRHKKPVEIETPDEITPVRDCATCRFEPDWLPYGTDWVARIGWCKKDLGVFAYNWFTSQIEPRKIAVLSCEGFHENLCDRYQCQERKYAGGRTITACPHWEERPGHTPDDPN